jgi:deoxycytidylate deaminase
MQADGARLAELAASRSTVVGHRRVGAAFVQGVNVVALGHNGVPTCLANLPAELVEAATQHAEMAALCNASTRGKSLVGTTLYCTLFPCVVCVRAALDAGCVAVVAPEPDYNDPAWGKQWKQSKALLAHISAQQGATDR